MKTLLMTLSVAILSMGAFAETAHIYKCSGVEAFDFYVAVSTNTDKGNDTAFTADDLCRGFDDRLSAHALNAVAVRVDSVAAIEYDNAFLASTYNRIKADKKQRAFSRKVKEIRDYRNSEWTRKAIRRKGLIDRTCLALTVREIYNYGLEGRCL